MNSTRTWVTPPREPVLCQILSFFLLLPPIFLISHTGTSEDTGDLNELDWDPAHILSVFLLRLTLLEATDFAESIFAVV